MARIPRIVIPDIPHHVTHHSVRQVELFASDKDKNKYLCLVQEQCLLQEVEIISWCLMTNHVHLICVPKKEDGLTKGIGEAHRRYSRYVNWAKGFKGHLFRERFYSCPMDEKHTVAAIRYIERNPVRSAVVKDSKDYMWSSARFRLGITNIDPFVKERSPFGLNVDWEGLLNWDPDEISFIRKRVRTGRVCGTDDFVKELEKMTGRKLRVEKPGKRPSKFELSMQDT